MIQQSTPTERSQQVWQGDEVTLFDLLQMNNYIDVLDRYRPNYGVFNCDTDPKLNKAESVSQKSVSKRLGKSQVSDKSQPSSHKSIKRKVQHVPRQSTPYQLLTPNRQISNRTSYYPQNLPINSIIDIPLLSSSRQQTPSSKKANTPSSRGNKHSKQEFKFEQIKEVDEREELRQINQYLFPEDRLAEKGKRNVTEARKSELDMFLLEKPVVQSVDPEINRVTPAKEEKIPQIVIQPPKQNDVETVKKSQRPQVRRQERLTLKLDQSVIHQEPIQQSSSMLRSQLRIKKSDKSKSKSKSKIRTPKDSSFDMPKKVKNTTRSILQMVLASPPSPSNDRQVSPEFCAVPITCQPPPKPSPKSSKNRLQVKVENRIPVQDDGSLIEYEDIGQEGEYSSREMDELNEINFLASNMKKYSQSDQKQPNNSNFPLSINKTGIEQKITPVKTTVRQRKESDSLIDRLQEAAPAPQPHIHYSPHESIAQDMASKPPSQKQKPNRKPIFQSAATHTSDYSQQEMKMLLGARGNRYKQAIVMEYIRARRGEMSSRQDGCVN